MKAGLFWLLLACSLNVRAGNLPEQTDREIQHLFTVLEQSDCRFQRNGHWYTPQEARTHLQRKYDYLRDRQRITDAESFITLGASTSSLSGKAYQVQCGDGPAIPSRSWFLEILRIDRQKRGGAGR